MYKQLNTLHTLHYIICLQEQLDVALSKVCNNFNEKQYEKLQSAYMLLGKTQV